MIVGYPLAGTCLGNYESTVMGKSLSASWLFRTDLKSESQLLKWLIKATAFAQSTRVECKLDRPEMQGQPPVRKMGSGGA